MPASEHYLDTNIFLSACLAEPASPRLRAWLETADSNFTTSDWALAEFSSALGVKVKRGELTTRPADGVLHVLEGDLLPAPAVFETESQLVSAAGMLVRSWPPGLRTDDAMHPAFCSRTSGLALAAADRLLGRAAHAMDIVVERIS